jgi:hypothetical protein
MNLATRLWRSRWNAARLLVAALLVWALAVDTPARIARLQLALLPDADLAAEVRTLRERGRFAEALVVADAGLAALDASDPRRDQLTRERAETQRRQQSMLRRLSDLARGALTGGGAAAADGPDASLELLLGAVATDLLVIGDVRDLVIQSARWARGQSTDPVIVALSGVGIATTAAPLADWAPSVLKAARKSGAMTRSMADVVVRAARDRNLADLRRIMDDAAVIARVASPAGAMRLFRHVDSADDAARLARFLERGGPAAARALHIGGEPAIRLAKSAESFRAAGRIDDALAIERTLLLAAGKGDAGAKWLARGLHRPLLRAHPLVGIAKSLWKGNAQALIARTLELFDPWSRWTLPAAAAWLFIEIALMLRRWWPTARRPAAMPRPAAAV